MIRVAILLLGVVLLVWSTALAADQIVIGAISDLTGATSDIGKPAAIGLRAAVAYLNEKGGVNGKRIKLMLFDYGYRVPEAVTIYERFRDVDKVSMLLQWGAGDTYALSPTVAKDELVSISDYLGPELCDPKRCPYNFICGTDYSTSAMAALTYWYEEVWKKSEKWKKARESGRKPKLVCFYMFASPAARASICALRAHALLLGMTLGRDQDVSLVTLDAKSQVLAAKEEAPTVIWHGNTTMSVATAIKDAYALKLGADHIVGDLGFDRNLMLLTGKAGEGVIGAAACAFPGMDVPYMREVMAYCKKLSPGFPVEKLRVSTIQSWAKVILAARALEIADKKGELTGPGLKSALESLRRWSLFDTAGALGVPPITITENDHRPSSVASLYTIRSGKIEPLTKIDMKKRFPDEWESWLRW